MDKTLLTGGIKWGDKKHPRPTSWAEQPQACRVPLTYTEVAPVARPWFTTKMAPNVNG